MSPSFEDDLVYPNLASCKMRLVGSGKNARPPVQLPMELREAASNLSSNGAAAEFLNDFALERAVLKRQEERNGDRLLKQATSREELERATITKMKTVTGADEAICIAMLRDHRYDVEESIEAYLANM
mmetsp:Transcript_11208/g.26946  ORF Transcript_11208/g.26946 Transcript_11208/m.26946 type:complete len:128 (-) Transcript_11208:466-849(-)|eukprot:CAMPEP_0197183348 /NCGR_PEP_ID=MMETSP1423-20130617/7774_1 /TAXON_ID=476441 /ORGANISM="Pseudo-nitzschia heimii, Strain UNC1101" /LENGTH=127 /DNA_ID=CAMNT_0042633925 /DNA_START=66 /DNA_END=449 /DNA_ORIENTATION=-